jgi:prevent-host-death family protein
MSVITVPVTEAKQRFTEIVKGVEDCFDRYLVTKNGKDAAIVMSAEEYESLLETLDVLSSKKETRALLHGTLQSRRGETVALDQYLAQKKQSANRGKHH